ncbi:MAG: 3-phosphoshikimate 1-carboxyvinyltransferase [Candidatus Eisenbacteria bacterium]
MNASRYRIRPGAAPRGRAVVPGDKSVTHRALLLGALAEGETDIRRPNRGGDCLATAAALRALGVSIEERERGWLVVGRGGELAAPRGPLDLGNSGTGVRLLAGVLAGQSFAATVDGDDSLRRRPMGRIVKPLRAMGAVIEGEGDGERLPLTIRGGNLKGIAYLSPVASAQVKSAILLAGLRAEGRTEVTEPGPSRDHTERMIAYFGGAIEREGLRASVTGGTRLRGAPVEVGGDPSSSAFFVVAALIVPGSDVVLEGVLDNRTRTAYLDVLERMGASLEREPMETDGPEPRLRLRVRSSKLRGTDVKGEEVPRLIDEIPVLAAAACVAEGVFRVRDAKELRVKESDRIRKIAETARAFGRTVDEVEDGFDLEGGPVRGAIVESGGDHRIAMAAAVLALAAAGPSEVRDTACVSTSLPEFLPMAAALGLGEAIEEG